MSCFDSNPDPVEVDPFACDDDCVEEQSGFGSASEWAEVPQFDTHARQLSMKFPPEVLQFVRGCERGEVRVHGA